MNLLDFLIFIPICYFCYQGFSNGVIKEVLSILGIILAVFITFNYMDAASSYIQPLFEEETAFVPFLSGALLFIGTIAIVQFLAYMLKKVLQTINLNIINRLAGLGFGFLKSSIAISALLILLAGFNMPSQQARTDSIAYPYIILVAPWAYDSVAALYPGSENFADTIRQTLDRYDSIENFPFLDQLN